MESWEAVKKEVIKSFVLNWVSFIWEKSMALLIYIHHTHNPCLPFELILWDELSFYSKSY